MANASCGLCSALNACSGRAEPGSDAPPPLAWDRVSRRIGQPSMPHKPSLGVVTIRSTFLGGQRLVWLQVFVFTARLPME